MITQRKFELDCVPRGQGRPRWGNGRMYKAGIDVEWEGAIREAYKAAHPDAPRYEHQAAVLVECYVPIPKSDSKVKRADKLSGATPCTVKPDIDNVVKSVLDALNGVAWEDDKQINSIWAAKIYSDRPRLVVTLRGKEEDAHENVHTQDGGS